METRNVNIRDIQLMQNDMLIQFDEFCKKNDLVFSFIGGTLLGAIRHSGFIPWDDDVDIGMPRPDYEKFILLTKTQEIAPDLVVVSGDTDDSFSLPFAKIFNTRTLVLQENKEYESDGNSIWIDVMPLDGLGDDYDMAKKVINKAIRYRKALGRASSKSWKLRTGEKGIIGYAKCVYRQIYKLVGYKFFKNKIIQLAKDNNYEKSKYIANLVWGVYGEGEIIEKQKFYESSRVVFENREYKAMGHAKEYLTNIYGDYMKLPPAHERVSPHNLKVIIKEIGASSD